MAVVMEQRANRAIARGSRGHLARPPRFESLKGPCRIKAQDDELQIDLGLYAGWLVHAMLWPLFALHHSTFMHSNSLAQKVCMRPSSCLRGAVAAEIMSRDGVYTFSTVQDSASRAQGSETNSTKKLCISYPKASPLWSYGSQIKSRCLTEQRLSAQLETGPYHLIVSQFALVLCVILYCFVKVFELL